MFPKYIHSCAFCTYSGVCYYTIGAYAVGATPCYPPGMGEKYPNPLVVPHTLGDLKKI